MYEKVPVQRLQIGMFVSLRDIPWFKHPFLITSFEITRPSEINDILALGYDSVLYDPKKSKAQPLAKDNIAEVEVVQKDFKSKESLKVKKASELRKRRQRFREMEQRFHNSLNTTESILDGIKNKDVKFYEDIKTIAAEMAETFCADVNLSVEHINMSAASVGQHYHSLNVMVLSMMLGKQLGIDKTTMVELGFGALSHDIGQIDFPKELVDSSNRKQLKNEQYRQHPTIGVQTLSKLPDISRNVMKIVYQHHELCDGAGFPKGLKEKEITLLAKIVSVADWYDRLINTRDPKSAMSPHKALAYLYGKKRACFEPECLDTFIKMLGVYPAGTVCRFSSGDVGVIQSVDPNDPMHPEFIIYDPAIPKYDAIIYKLGVDLDLRVDTTCGINELEPDAITYLDSRALIQYFPSAKG